MPSSSETRASSAPVVIAIHEPNDIPAAQIGRSGYRSCRKSMAERKSSFSPGPASNVPALRPTPRKLKRSAATPMRGIALAAWYNALVCIVPPCSGCGWPKIATARGSPSGRSSSASSGPIGPGISRRNSDAIHKPFEDAGKRVRTRDQSEMAGPLQHDVFRLVELIQIPPRHVDRHDAIELGLAGEQQHRRLDRVRIAEVVRLGPRDAPRHA